MINFPESAHSRESSTTNTVAVSTHTAGEKTIANRRYRESNKMNTNKPPIRQRNVDVRSREYLTEIEVNRLRVAARKLGRHGQRDELMILMAYRHALRPSELVNTKWANIELKSSNIHINRLKNGDSGSHKLLGPELRLLRPLRKANPHAEYVFTNERGTVVSDSSFRKIVARAGVNAGLEFSVHPHMLRHACGFYLANKDCDSRIIQVYFGHKDIKHTTRYTKLSAKKFANLWPD